MSSEHTASYADTIVASINELANRAIAEYAFEDVAQEIDSRRAELVAIGCRIRDWHNLNRRIEFLTMVAERVTFLGILKNEGITLRLVGDDRFVSEPKTLPDDVREWIIANRPAIVAELKRG